MALLDAELKHRLNAIAVAMHSRMLVVGEVLLFTIISVIRRDIQLLL